MWADAIVCASAAGQIQLEGNERDGGGKGDGNALVKDMNPNC